MTVLFTIIGFIVFVVSLFTATFKVAFKRQLMFTLTGLTIDMLIVAVAATVMFVSYH